MNTCKKLLGAACIAALPAFCNSSYAATLPTVEVQLLAVHANAPAFAGKLGASELSWTICVQQEQSCRMEEFRRQLRLTVPAGRHSATLRVSCKDGKVLRFERSFTIVGSAPAEGSKVIVEADACPQGRAQ